MINTWEELKEKVRSIKLNKFYMNDDTIDMYNGDVTFIFYRDHVVYVSTEMTGSCKIINFCPYEIMSHLIDCLLAVE